VEFKTKKKVFFNFDSKKKEEDEDEGILFSKCYKNKFQLKIQTQAPWMVC
jgi:hypothetical protein